jgi:hypothetical protein
MSLSAPFLKPQDLVVTLAIHALGEETWTYATLATRLGLSDSHAHAGVQRAARSHLVDVRTRRVRAQNVLEFLEHGVRYAFPADPGPFTRGVPTASWAPPLRSLLRSDPEAALVWPYLDGTTTGQSVTPLYAAVPSIVLKQPTLYELLALVDALRLGGARERQVAVQELRKRLGVNHGG